MLHTSGLKMKLSLISASGRLRAARGSMVAVPLCFANGYCCAKDGLERLWPINLVHNIQIGRLP